MARRRKVNYWKSRNAYYCVINGRQCKLAEGPEDSWIQGPDGKYIQGPTYKAAVKRWLELEELQNVDLAGDTNRLRVIFETHLSHISTKRKPHTLRTRVRMLNLFANFKPDCDHEPYGEKPVSKLTHFDFYRFVEAMQEPAVRGRNRKTPVPWGSSSIWTAAAAINAALNWAVKSGLIPRNPLRDIERPAETSRGAIALIGNDAEEIERNHQKILKVVPPALRPVLQALKETGCRPEELREATVADFDPDLEAIVFHKEGTRPQGRFSHKTAHKNKDRVIFLTGEPLTFVREAAARYGKGPLFRTDRGMKLPENYISELLWRKRRLVGLLNLTAYSYRHTFATEMLKAGMDIESLAELMGNTPEIIRKHYSHLLADRRGLKAKLNRFKQLAGTRRSPGPSHVGPDAADPAAEGEAAPQAEGSSVQ